ncbi:AcrR family transcriptional regulator [Lipingzhangella halophila]|uniref:AcrR family transcriptional regulator n=1 Tax=Lipingzhangella halophila TaxID=1783352 RepID=A0A7W7W048_9ACTN|nr:TetR/AcrR family transcriptional regulator [Lipingzhangella halophila]MBB4929517.1 AcrR family transcriptional regulator [Lipingzhangella halophila]
MTADHSAGADAADPAPRTKAQQREATMRELIAAGRELFARNGFGAVSLAELTQRAGVTKGALYHHFGSKMGLFRAVVAEVQYDVGARVAAAAEATPDPWTRLTSGCAAFLAASSDREVQQIMLVDGPAVLGWSEWRAMDEAASERHLTEALTELVEDGTIAHQPVRPLVHLLSGAMNEAALWLARSGDPKDLSDTVAALTRLLESLRAEGAPGPGPAGQ